MIRTALKYYRPATIVEASSILADHHGTAAVLGGGSQILPRLMRDELRIDTMVDLRDMRLRKIEWRDERLEIGARTTYGDLLASDLVATYAPLLRRVSQGITGGNQIVRTATPVGSACFNAPGTDVPAVLVALDAAIQIHGPNGASEIPARKFLLGAHSVALGLGELVTGFAVRSLTYVGHYKLKHSVGSWPIATASAVRRSGSDRIEITLGAVGEVPIQLTVGTGDDLPRSIAAVLQNPWSDVLAPATYRAAVAPVVARRAIAELKEYSA